VDEAAGLWIAAWVGGAGLTLGRDRIGDSG
jgi:hypothetical protein